MKYSELDICNHLTIHSYNGYVNIYYCGMCGLRFSITPKYDKFFDGNESIHKEHRHK